MTRIVAVLGALAATVLASSPATGQPAAAGGSDVLPRPDPPFQGVIGRSLADSRPDMPKPVEAPKGAPNILLVMTDDVGFAAASTFGGVIPTPNLDQLAAGGLRYNRFHTTAMCSPTRAALLTGRNAHAVGFGIVTESASGYPGYDALFPRDVTTIARILRDNGYSTAMFGKHHNVARLQNSQAGPFSQWPTGLGFDYFYGFLGGGTDQFHPKLYRNTQPVATPRDPNYILDDDLATDLIRWVRNQKAASQDKPFFAYLATGSTHAPHQAPKEWIAKFRGRFDGGWDALRGDILARQKAMGVVPPGTELTPRPKEIPAWDSLTPTQRKVDARMMEVYAGMLAFQDYQFGRIVAALRSMGQLDDTLVVFVEGDNGASGEGHLEGTLNEMGHLANRFDETPAEMVGQLDAMGGPDTEELYPIGWALAMDTPFQWVKQIASHLGGIRNGLVVSWPNRIAARGEVRSQFHHVVDIAPTLLEAAGIRAPTVVDGMPQRPMDGVSMVYTFADAQAADRRTLQYFELLGNRALYQDGWLANTVPLRLPFELSPRPGDYRWEIYDLRNDFSQAHDLSATEPERLQAMQAAWWREAERNHALPVDDNLASRDRTAAQTAGMAARRSHLEYTGGEISMSSDSGPFLGARSFAMSATLDVPKGRATGVIAASGSRFGGWCFYLKDGRPVAYHAFSHKPADKFRVAAARALPAGPAVIRYEFEYDGGGFYKGGVLHVSVNGQEVASGRVGRTTMVGAPLGETFDVGRDTGVTVNDEYAGEGTFPGAIDRVVFDLGPFTAKGRVAAR